MQLRDKHKMKATKPIKYILKTNFFPITLLIYCICMVILGIFLLTGSIDITTNAEESNVSNSGYFNEEYGFVLNPPEDWIIDDPDLLGSIVRFYGPTEDEFTMNLGIDKIFASEAGETLNSFVEQQIIALYPDLFTDFSIVSSKTRTINGMNAYEIVYTFTQDSSGIKQKQILIEKNDVIYTLIYSASPNSYDSYVSVIEPSVNSFTVI